MAEANDRTAGADIDLSSPRVIHIVGVGGVGMAPISGALVGMGHRVSGSDHLELPILRQVRDAGVRVLVGHDAANIPGDADVVAYSTAVPADNLELRVARERGIPVVHRSGLLAAMAAVKRTIGVAGTHGKTTTSAMLAHILGAAGERGVDTVLQWWRSDVERTMALIGAGSVAELDRSFLRADPTARR